MLETALVVVGCFAFVGCLVFAVRALVTYAPKERKWPTDHLPLARAAAQRAPVAAPHEDDSHLLNVLSPLHPLSALNPLNQAMYTPAADPTVYEPAPASHVSYEPSPSHDSSYGHSHSSHDSGYSSSHDGGSSGSWDSGSSGGFDSGGHGGHDGGT